MITTQEKIDLLEQRLDVLDKQKYNYELDVIVWTARKDQVQIQRFQELVDTTQAAIDTLQAMLDELKGVS